MQQILLEQSQALAQSNQILINQIQELQAQNETVDIKLAQITKPPPPSLSFEDPQPQPITQPSPNLIPPITQSFQMPKEDKVGGEGFEEIIVGREESKNEVEVEVCEGGELESKCDGEKEGEKEEEVEKEKEEKNEKFEKETKKMEVKRVKGPREVILEEVNIYMDRIPFPCRLKRKQGDIHLKRPILDVIDTKEVESKNEDPRGKPIDLDIEIEMKVVSDPNAYLNVSEADPDIVKVAPKEKLNGTKDPHEVKVRKTEEGGYSIPPPKVILVPPDPPLPMHSIFDCDAPCDNVPSPFVLGRKRFRWIDKGSATPLHHLCEEDVFPGVKAPKIMVGSGRITYIPNGLRNPD